MARAISYYASKGYAVFVPVSDVSRYDLVVDNGIQLLKVEVKTTLSNKDQVKLATSGGNQSWSGVTKRLSADDCDIVFVVNLKTGVEQEFASADLDGRTTVTVRQPTLDWGVSGDPLS